VTPASGDVATVLEDRVLDQNRPSTDDERDIVAGCSQPEVAVP
jgi:hypothetical protein